MAPKGMTVEKAVDLKKDLEARILQMLNEYTQKTGIVLGKISLDPNKEAQAEIRSGQLQLLDDAVYYLRVDIDGVI